MEQTAKIKAPTTFYNESPGYIFFSGKINEDTIIKKTGTGIGALTFNEITKVSGASEYYNEGSGSIIVQNNYIPNGVKIQNKSKRANIYVNQGVSVEPNTEIVFNKTNPNTGSLNISGAIKANTYINHGGEGAGAIHLRQFGGTINLICDGDKSISLYQDKTDWDGQTIRYKVYTQKTNVEKYLWLYTSKFGSYLDVESVKHVSLSGTYEDNTKIRITGNSDSGNVNLYGNYSDTVYIELNCIGRPIIFLYSDMKNNLHFHCNANHPSGGTYYIYGKFKDNFTINNNSKQNIIIERQVNIGENVTINVSEDYLSTLRITQDIPDGTTVDY